MTAPRKTSTRPQAKTASRKAFEHEYGVQIPGTDIYLYRKLWEAFLRGWQLARGGKPTTREKDV